MKSFPITKKINIGGDGDCYLYTCDLPVGLKLLPDCGIIVTEGIDGSLIYENPDGKGTYEVRGTITPSGDMILMFPCGEHYTSKSSDKPNTMLMMRSTDGGTSWSEPTVPFDIPYAQHGFIPLIPKGDKRIYCFGTQPVHDEFVKEHGLGENAPIGYFYSDDDGHTWEGPTMIRPIEDPTYRGMSVTRMCETSRGTWIIGSHEAYWGEKPLKTYQYLLRSEDKGKTWHILPRGRTLSVTADDRRDTSPTRGVDMACDNGSCANSETALPLGELREAVRVREAVRGCEAVRGRRGGWQCPLFGRMDEGRPIHVGGDEVLAMFRTPEGHLWCSRSLDDGKSWSDPEPTPLIHPDAPPMVFMLSDGTLACFHHNRHHDKNYSGLSGDKSEIMADRSEIWVAFSSDGGVSWSEPRFVFANACTADYEKPFFNFQCSYIDVIPENGKLHILVPHLWHRILHLEVTEEALKNAPTKEQLKEGTHI